MASRQKARVVFASAVVLLIFSGVAAAVSIVKLLQGENWIIHTHDVQAALGELDSAVAQTTRMKQVYVATRYAKFLVEFQESVSGTTQNLKKVRNLTLDNPKQQQLCSHLEDVVDRRIALLRKSIDLARTEPQNNAAQDQLTRQDVSLALDTNSTIRQMGAEEQVLLNMRGRISRSRFNLTVIILALTFVFSLAMFSLHYKLLSEELIARAKAEQRARASEVIALQSQEASRQLSMQLLHIQDEERRKFSRELHDSLGQYLAGVKMHLGMLSADQLLDSNLRQCIELLDQSITEVRTLSYLLHPPLLDDAGLAAAASWYVEGFSKRSGIAVSLTLPPEMERLPEAVELSLFRVLQESLTNIHRHSKSVKADIALETSDDVILRIRDFGTGFSPELLKQFRSSLTNTGVGLSGMRERVREVGGELEIQSDGTGSVVLARIPLARELKSEIAVNQVFIEKRR
jgi:signal transduction histidine kinase